MASDEQVQAWLESDEPGNFDLPVGSLEHRVWQCPAFANGREEFESRCMKAHIRDEFSMDNKFVQAHTSGLLPAWEHPSYRAQPPDVSGSFEWIMRDQSVGLSGRSSTPMASASMVNGMASFGSVGHSWP